MVRRINTLPAWPPAADHRRLPSSRIGHASWNIQAFLRTDQGSFRSSSSLLLDLLEAHYSPRASRVLLPHSPSIVHQQLQQSFLPSPLPYRGPFETSKQSGHKWSWSLRGPIAMASVAVGTKRTFAAMVGDTARNGDWASPARSTSSHGPPDHPRVMGGVEGTCKP